MNSIPSGPYSECLARLNSQDATAAFQTFIDHAATLSTYTCSLKWEGRFWGFRYERGGEWPFAFIVNRYSLLFYFRKAGLMNRAADARLLSREFGDVNAKSNGEITVRVQSEEQAKRLIGLVFGGA